jgi:hypothetical protein
MLIMAICILGVMLRSRQMKSRQTPTPDIPVFAVPSAMPDNNFPIYFPIIQVGSVDVQIWKVINIMSSGYELAGQRYDVATFMRLDSQVTAQAYCIDRGLDIPDVGTEYLLNAEGIFVPLGSPAAHPIQRFLKIQE